MHNRDSFRAADDDDDGGNDGGNDDGNDGGNDDDVTDTFDFFKDKITTRGRVDSIPISRREGERSFLDILSLESLDLK